MFVIPAFAGMTNQVKNDQARRMKIKLKLFATLQEYLPPGSSGSETELELPEAATVPDALGALGVPLNLAHIVFVNGRQVLRSEIGDRRLNDGDVLAAFPAVGGG